MATDNTTEGRPPPIDLLQLQKWANLNFPERVIRPTVFHSANENTIAIKDKFPKAIYHWLVLPRPRDGVTLDDLGNLRTLLGSRSKVGKERAKEVLDAMGAHAKSLRDEMKNDMKQRYKFEWEVYIGFHALPSMTHLHLHVISCDFHNETLKTKKHFNSFHPKHGFFLHYDDVMSWFDATPSFFKDKISSLRPSNYEHLLKLNLSCHLCPQSFRNMPLLKAHLEAHFKAKFNAVLKAYEREKKLAQASKPSSKASSSASSSKKRKHDGKPSSVASASSGTSGRSKEDRSSEGGEKRRKTGSDGRK